MFTQEFNFSLMVILTALFSRNVSQAACSPGWFGRGCKYKCWCRYNKCRSNGECVSGTPCVDGWFGPSCQYRNLMLVTQSQGKWIQDGFLETCNPGTPSIDANFDDSYHFTWLRIVYNETALNPESSDAVYFDFKDSYNNTVDCTFKRVFTVNPRTVDIHCQLSTSINQITLRGRDFLRICEVFFNGGRNLALKQQTNQSSVLVLASGRQYSSSLVVDGSRNTNINKGSCSRTDYGDTNGTWFLYYPRSVIIDSVSLLNRDTFQELLQGFIFKMFDVNGTLVQYYKDTGLIKSEYRLSFSNLQPVSMIRIQTVSAVLTLCEVETYGEMICPRLKWGFDCMDDCWCKPHELCSPVTGICAKECKPGFYGLLCDTNCPKNCLNLQCFMDTGTCNKCKLGYMGDYCDIECLPNKYGIDCLLTCHSNCRKRNCSENVHGIDDGRDCSERLCDHDGLCNACNDTMRYGMDCTTECPVNCRFKRCNSKDGSCYSCNTGFYGKNCSHVCSDHCKDGCEYRSGVCYECKSIFYGNNCALPCPITCIERDCHSTLGTCLQGCPKGLHGPICSYDCPKLCKNMNCYVTNGSCIEGCETGVFGATCIEICPRRCHNRICDFLNGSCFTCDKSFYGKSCELRCSEDCSGHTCDIHNGLCIEDDDRNYHLDVLLPIASVIVLLILGMALLWRREGDEGPEEGSYSSYS